MTIAHDTAAPATTAEEALAAPQMVAVGLYMVDRAYGGPEEGGWYYDRGEIVEDIEAHLRLGAFPASFGCLADAGAFMRALEPAVDAMNKGRPEIGHSNSRGRYELLSFEAAIPPRSFPDRRPAYDD